MTGYTVHTGASKKFVNGWDRIFSGEAEPKPAQAKQKKAKKKATKKKARK